jgi:hypothetical protein
MKTNFTKMFLTLAIAFCTVTAFAIDISGSGGTDNVTAEVANGVLTISGTGATADYQQGDKPLESLSFTTVVVENGVTKLGDYLFEGVGAVTIYLMGNATALGSSVFDNATNVTAWAVADYSSVSGWSGANITPTVGYTLNITPPSNGSYEYVEGHKPFLYGATDKVMVKAKADPGYGFSKWDVGGTAVTDETTEITFSSANIALTLTFLPSPSVDNYSCASTALTQTWTGTGIDISGDITIVTSSNAGTVGTVYYNGKTDQPVNVGEYVISFDVAESPTYFAKGTLTLAEKLKIVKKTPEITDLKINGAVGTASPAFEPKEPWTGSEHSVSIVPNGYTTTQIGEIKVEYQGNATAGTEYSRSGKEPTDVGTYDIIAVIPGGTCFEKDEAFFVGTLEIEPLDIKKEFFKLELDGKSWNGTPIDVNWNNATHQVTATPISTIPEGAIGEVTKVNYYDASTSLLAEAPKEVGGPYTVKLVVEPGAGYAISGGTELEVGEFSITLIPRTFTPDDFEFTPKEAKADNKQHEVTVKPKAADIIEEGLGLQEVKYDDGSNAATTTVPSTKGEYTITVSYAAGDGYAAVGSLTLGKFVIGDTIASGSLKYDEFDGNEIPWDGNPHGVDVTKETTAGGGALTVLYYDKASKEESSVRPVNAGSYTVFASIAAIPGNISERFELGTFHIIGKTPSAADLNIAGIGSFDYNGDKREVTVTRKSEGLGTIKAVYYNDKDAAPSEVGEYAIFVEIEPGTAFKAVDRLRIGTLTISQPTNPPTITRQVELPAVPSGVTLSKPVGKNPVISGGNFTFTIKGAKAEPEVNSSGGNKVDMKANGSDYDVTVYSITSNISITIDIPTGNAEIEGTQIWSSGGRLYISSAQSGEARIYNLTGSQVKTLVLSAGETVAESLATGLYIVTLDGKTQKIHVH